MSSKIEVDAEVLLRIADELGALKERMEAVPHDTHNEQHDWLKERIEAEKRRKEFWVGMKEKLITRGVFGSLTLLGVIVWYALTQFFKHH